MKHKILVNEKELLKLYPLKTKSRITKAIQELKSSGLLPLEISNSESFSNFVHLLGLRYSDGCIYEQVRNNSYTFYICFGNRLDAEKLVNDCKRIWNLDLDANYGTRAYYVYLPSSIARIMILAGSPVGRKTSQHFRVPKWIFDLPDNMKWEFVSGIFTGDGSAPKLQSEIECSQSLTLSLNSEKKIVRKFCNGFMNDIHLLLAQMGIKSSKPAIGWCSPRISKSDVITYPVRLRILTQKKNMIKFLKNVNYRYSVNHYRNSKTVLEVLEGNKQINKLKTYLSNPSQKPPRICVFLGQSKQKELIEKAAKGFSKDHKIGMYKSLAKHLFLECDNAKDFRNLHNNYLPDWKHRKKFIPIDCVLELARLSNININKIERDIKEVKFIRVHNKFAVPYKGDNNDISGHRINCS